MATTNESADAGEQIAPADVAESAEQAKPNDVVNAGEQSADGKQTQNAPDKKQLEKSITAAKKVVETQKLAESLKERAMKAVNPKERLKLLKEAYHKEVEAHGQSKYAKRLQSGLWQGGGVGGGIGAGVAMGVGAVTGTLVSGLVAVPTILLGGLVGVGVGSIKGPLIKLGGGGEETKEKLMSDEEIRKQAMQEAERLDQAVEKGASTVPKPPEEDVDQEATESHPGHPSNVSEAGESTGAPERRKPKKLQVRSANEVSSTPERKKPRKIEVRSAKTEHA